MACLKILNKDCSLLPDLASSGHIEYKSLVTYPATLDRDSALDVSLHAYSSRDAALAENYVYTLYGSWILRNGDDPMLKFEPVNASILCATIHICQRPRTCVTGLGVVKWRSERQHYPTDLTFVMTHSDYDIYSKSMHKFDVRYKASMDVEDIDAVEVGSILYVYGEISGYSTEKQTFEIKVDSVTVTNGGPPLEINFDPVRNPDDNGLNEDESASSAGRANFDATAEEVQENVISS
ncbi:hypothetical protein PCASD_25627 [Puccinia coronata f. sp. avenae]|uniref:Uncharacterized protein n=1 Tax=Puccinia coronata f. sp. avenae TaxID=200324 RepID=A0A2N5RX93_9BASI|nr:hypothetical protein PCASD_25627 [Puccinia coronata f. sp. avenae]